MIEPRIGVLAILSTLLASRNRRDLDARLSAFHLDHLSFPACVPTHFLPVARSIARGQRGNRRSDATILSVTLLGWQAVEWRTNPSTRSRPNALRGTNLHPRANTVSTGLTSNQLGTDRTATPPDRCIVHDRPHVRSGETWQRGG